MNLDFEVKVKVRVKVDRQKGGKPELVDVKSLLNVPKELDETMYLNEDGLPNADGVRCISNNLVAALVGNIRYAHSKGYANDVEMMKAVKNEIDRHLFASGVEVLEGTYD